LLYIFYKNTKTSLNSIDISQNPYLETLKIHQKEGHHPYRYFKDENGKKGD
jgi:hypothetical protein